MTEKKLVEFDGCLYDVFKWLAGGDENDPGLGNEYRNIPDLIVYGNRVYSTDVAFILRVEFKECPLPEGCWNFVALSYGHMVIVPFENPIAKGLSKKRIDRHFDKDRLKRAVPCDTINLHGYRVGCIVYPHIAMRFEMFTDRIFATAVESEYESFDKGVIDMRSVLMAMNIKETQQ